MRADFTLVPIGGLGNRINAICSAIVYCQQNNKSLEILWFKDHGLNCSVKELFSIHPDIKNVWISDARLSDFLLRDNPRRRNFWLPTFFQYFLYDRRIYESEVYRVVSSQIQPDFGDLTPFSHIFMVSYWRFWTDQDMWKRIVIAPSISQMVDMETKRFSGRRSVGIHIRRTDHIYAIKESPIHLFISSIQNEIDKFGDGVCFYLASDSLGVKEELVNKFGDKIITSMKPTSRNNKQGIIDAFVELNVLSQTDKIYASSKSSFSEMAHFLSNNEFEELTLNK